MPAQYALRPIRLWDLPTLKRWRGLPEVSRHLRHPKTSWLTHLRWWLRIRHHRDPSCRVWAVTYKDRLVGQAGLYYRTGPAAEVSVLVMLPDDTENWQGEYRVVRRLLPQAARDWGLDTLWAEVLATAPIHRHGVFPAGSSIWADHYSTLYRWRIA